MKGLAVDDSAVMRKIMVLGLNEVGILDVDEADDGAQGLANALNTDYDMILLDWNMPKMNGLQLVRELRAAGKTAPVIMVTSESDRAHVIEAIREGADNYVIKPFQRPILVQRILETLEAVRSGSRRLRKGGAGPGPSPAP